MSRATLVVLCALAVCPAAPVATAHAVAPHTSAPPPPSIYRAAFDAADRGDWRRALGLAERGGRAELVKVVRWLWLKSEPRQAGFEALTGFIAANPDWPGMARLRRGVEEAIDTEAPAGPLRAWFDRNPPESVNGIVAYAEALRTAGRAEQADALLRRAWVEQSFGRRQQAAFYRRYRKILSREDNVRRLDRLLWDGHIVQAERMMRYVPTDVRALALARIRLRAMHGGVDWAIDKVPEHLADDPGLRFERVMWRRRKGREAEAAELLRGRPEDPVRPHLWARERVILAQGLLADGHPALAYDLVRVHRLNAGQLFARAEWLSGWIALRFLDRPRAALGHFERLAAAVTTPISEARAAYWAGRAAAALGDHAAARAWFVRAAARDGTYYGQLAQERMTPAPTIRFAHLPPPSRQQRLAFAAHELTLTARALAEVGEAERIDPFVRRLAELFPDPAGRRMTALLARSLDRLDLAVAVARETYRDTGQLLAEAFPVIDGLDGAPEPALIHAVVRQESAFKTDAVSHAGARGLMQLMPATARQVAREEDLRYRRARLTGDPDYNVRLGSAHLQALIERYDGSYLLALAAYNAGPGSVERWIRKLGDPRRSEVDAVDWIEMIPYGETSNYVQRVLEGLQVYRARLGGGRLAATLARDLMR